MHAQNGISCLFKASQNGHLEVVKHLVERGGEALLMMTDKVSEDAGCVVGWLVCVFCFNANTAKLGTLCSKRW